MLGWQKDRPLALILRKNELAHDEEDFSQPLYGRLQSNKLRLYPNASSHQACSLSTIGAEKIRNLKPMGRYQQAE